MSRGPGRVERVIQETFTAYPDRTFSIADLGALVYPGLNRVEKKHRVALLRAANKVGDRMWWQGRAAETPGGAIVYRNLVNVRSYTHGMLRTSFGLSKVDADERVDNPTADRSEWAQMQPNGAFWIHVEINKARRDGRLDEAEAMLAALQARYKPLLDRATAQVIAISRR